MSISLTPNGFFPYEGLSYQAGDDFGPTQAEWFDGFTQDWTDHSGSVIHNLTLGNGTLEAWYNQIGPILNWHGKITFGTTTAMPASVSPFLQNIQPSHAHDVPSGMWAAAWDSSALALYPLSGAVANEDGYFDDFDGSTLSSTVPFTWADGDILMWNGFVLISDPLASSFT